MSTLKRILYISYDGMTDPLGQSQVIPYLAGLRKAGYEFTILSFEKRQRFAREGALVQGLMDKADIRWKPLFFTSRPPILSKIYDRWKMRHTATKLMRTQHFDMLHCRSYISSELGLLFKKKFGSKFLFDMRGFWADEKKDNGQWDLNKPLFRLIYKHYKRLEKDFLLQADGIVSLTQAAADELHRQPMYKDVTIDIIPCCADLEHFDYHKVDPTAKRTLASELGIADGEKIITYLGSIGGWYMTDAMFAFYKLLLKQYPEFKMLILTKETQEEVAAAAAGSGIPSEKLIVRYVPRQDLPTFLSLSDCSIFFIRPTYSKIASSPTKHAELMGMGIPVICNVIGDTGNIIRETDSGVEVDHFSTEDYEKCIAKIPKILAIPKETIREGAFKYFDLQQGIKSYENLYSRIFKNNG
ncbi:MAG: glycosyltransferase [Chitinophagaceae bacterium]